VIPAFLAVAIAGLLLCVLGVVVVTVASAPVWLFVFFGFMAGVCCIIILDEVTS
jgi:hypothetical protein